MKIDRIVEKNNKLLNEVINIHCDSLPNDILPKIGKDFLFFCIYNTAIQTDHTQLIITKDNGKVTGFVLVSKDSSKYYKDVIIKNIFHNIYYGCRLLYKRTISIPELLQIIKSLTKNQKPEIKGEIVIIAVEKKYQGQGIGKMLVQESVQYLKSNKVKKIKIKTIANNTNWINMFIRMGWHISNRFKLLGNEYVLISSEI